MIENPLNTSPLRFKYDPKDWAYLGPDYYEKLSARYKTSNSSLAKNYERRMWKKIKWKPWLYRRQLWDISVQRSLGITRYGRWWLK